SDPPFHAEARRLLLPAFSPKAIAPLEDVTRTLCRSLIDALVEGAGDDGTADAATGYAQEIPVAVIAHMLGLPPGDGDRFRAFIHRILEKPGQVGPVDDDDTLFAYLTRVIAEHRADRRDDLIGHLLEQELDGQPL